MKPRIRARPGAGRRLAGGIFCALALAGASVRPLFAAAYTAAPLRPRTPPAPGGRRFEVLSPAATGVNIPNVFDDPRMWGSRFRELTLGAVETGVAVADFDGDGRMDIFAVSKNGPCALYRQVAPFKFVDVARAAGVACDEPGTSKTGVSVVDINQDGWPDLYVCRYDAPNLLFVNNRDGTFTERAHEYGLDIKDASVHAIFGDYDRDGAVDCYLVTNIEDFSRSPQGRRDYLLHNDGNGHFTDVTTKAGIWGLTQGHTALWIDINHDGWPDLYVGNDFEAPDRLYLNRGDGTFIDVVDKYLPHVTYFSMGADSGDLDNDGLMDFMITDMRDRTHAAFAAGMEEIGRGAWELDRGTELIPQYMRSSVFLDTGAGRFDEVAHLTGMDSTGWTWSARFGDLDNDGRLDAFVTSGMIRNFVDADLVDRQYRAPTLAARVLVWKNAPPRRETTLAYRNLGNLRFEDVSRAWGLAHEGVSFGCALADLAGDGDLDLVFSNYDAPPTIIRNHTVTGHRVEIRLKGRPPNREGIGAEVRIETASGVQVRDLFTERGVASSDPPILHFGLGADTLIRKAIVRWPRGEVQTLENLPVDDLITILQPPDPPGFHPPPANLGDPTPDTSEFEESAKRRGLTHVNAVRAVDEFTRQRLLPHRFENTCAALAVADVNGDGIDDVFVGGCAGHPAQLFLGRADGTFAPAKDQPWAAEPDTDVTNACFFDVNGDGLPDLLVVHGGVAYDDGDPRLDNRLYLNAGHGDFAPAPEGTLPEDRESTSVAAAADFDGDGHADLFVGGRVVPGRYPAVPRSFLYHNEGGKLVDRTDELAPGLRRVGMVTAAVWADIDGDGRPDLLLATEWGPIVYFHNTGHGFEDWTTKAGLSGITGWWRAVAVADVDGDGRPDIIAGNVGLNTKYHATAAEPTLLFAGDMDGSGRHELVEGQYEKGELYPVRGRSTLGYVFPWLTKKFPTFRAFGEATLADIFGAEHLAGVRRLAATELASGVFRQQPDGTFRFIALPRMAQIAPVNAIVAADLDGDGKLDVYCAGNDFGPEPSTGHFDGGVSLLLKGDGHGGFTPVPTHVSGLVVPGETRAAGRIRVPGTDGPSLVVVRSNARVLLFTPRRTPDVRR